MSTEMGLQKAIEEAKFSRFHWYLFLLCLCVIIFDGYDLVIYSATLPVLMEKWDLTAAESGLIGSYALFGAAVGAIAFGYIADKIGRKKSIIICVILFSGATVLCGFADTPTSFKIFRFITGLGIGGAMPNTAALASEYAPIKNRGLMIVGIFSGMQIGGIMAAGISMYVIPWLGWRYVYFIGLFPLFLLPLFIIYLPESPFIYMKQNRGKVLEKIIQKIRPHITLNLEKEKNQADTSKIAFSEIFANGRTLTTLLCWIIFFMSMFMIFGLSIWLPKLMINKGYSLGGGLWFLASLNLGALIGGNISGYIADRIGAKKMMIIDYLLAFVSISLLCIPQNMLVTTLLIALAGTGFYGGQNIGNSYFPSFYPPKVRSTAMGSIFGVGRLGAIFGPAIVGIMMSFNFSNDAYFIILAAPGVIATVCLLLIKESTSYSFKTTSPK